MFIKFEKKKNSKTNLTDPPDQANKRFLELNPHIIKVRTSYVNKTYDKGRVYELGDEKLKMTVKGKEEERGGVGRNEKAFAKNPFAVNKLDPIDSVFIRSRTQIWHEL